MFQKSYWLILYSNCYPLFIKFMEVITMKTKYTVITGASSGIGRAVALKFAERNKNLILICTKK